MKIKICGITNILDANLSVSFGADFLGFIFYKKSPRYIKPKLAKDIIQQLPEESHEIKCVGVFVNSSLEEILETVDMVKLSVIQLHGNETNDFLLELKEALREEKITIIKAIHKEETTQDFESDYLLIDAPPEGDQYGGRGVKSDIELIKNLSLKKNLKNKIIIAGGINPENILSYYNQFDSFALDICSGVEKSPGIKDPEKLKTLFRNLERK